MKKLSTTLCRYFFLNSIISIVLTAITFCISFQFNYSEQIDNNSKNSFHFMPLIFIIILVVSVISFLVSLIFIKSINNNIDDVGAYKEFKPFSLKIQSQKKIIEKLKLDLQLEKDKINTLVANINEGFLMLDINKTILMENDKASILLSSINRNLIGRNLSELTENKEFLECIDKSINGEIENVKFAENDKNIHAVVSPVFSNNKANGVICLMVNVTENEKNEKIRREFTANVSHELKTPLTSISGYAEMIENGMAQSDDIQRFAGKIHKEAGRMINLISDIIELSHLDEPEKELEKEDVRLDEITAECFDSLSNSAEKNNIDLKYVGGEITYFGNKAMLYEIIYNLCDNAIRYNKPNGKVTVDIKENMGRIEISVTDTGIGIPYKHHTRIFERFYRIDKSHSKETGGTGLGLAIVKHMVEQHEGHLQIYSAVKTGTTIKVILPL